MERRAMLAMLIALPAWLPTCASAQQPQRMLRVGVLSDPAWSATDGLRSGLRDRGYIEGQTVAYEYRWTVADDFPALAAELTRLPVDIIVTWGAAATIAAESASAEIPIVMASMGEVVAGRLVSALSRPGGNVTGSLSQTVALNTKRLELLRELVPAGSRVVYLGNASNPNTISSVRSLEPVARALGLTLVSLPMEDSDLSATLSALVRLRPDAVLVAADPSLLTQRRQITQAMAENRLLAIYGHRDYAEAGGLASYGANYYELFRRAAVYVDKIAKGAKPSELPVQQADRFEFVINVAAAQAIGFKLPHAVLARADEIIE
jgi:putative tryptophan/tyrosine transport system substrate-binding protein